jgi:Methylamine utilization protein MauJ
MPQFKDLKLIGSSKEPSLKIPDEQLGTPGARIELHIVPRFEGDEAPDVLANITKRLFRVSARLAHAPSIIGQIRADFTEGDGDSFLMLPNEATQLRIDTAEGCFYIRSNKARQLSLIEWECRAISVRDARTRFIEAVYPALDHFSYSHNVPLFVAMVRVFDVTHQSTHIECNAPYRLQVVPNSMNRLFLDMKPIYAMYREAKNSDSYFYRFLCCYKIMEGLLGGMRASVFERAKKSEIQLTSERDIVPDNEDLAPEFKLYVGKSIKVLFDNVLTGKFRHAVAHFTTEEGALHISSAMALDKYASVALIADLCARQLIASHERLLTKLLQA